MFVIYSDMKKRCLLIMISIFFLLACIKNVCAEEIKDNSLYSKSAVLMDTKTKRVLYEKNGYEPLPMASTTKIMTCIIALENADTNKVIKVSKFAASMPAVHLQMEEGEEYYLNDLLYSLMLESHNDTAVAIAEGVSGDLDAFLKLMNEKAIEIGCEDTLFLTPNGLDKSVKDQEENELIHHTTAADLAKIMSYCINESPKADDFLKITRTQTYTFSDVSGKRMFTCNNHNSFLNMMDGALSGKTGFTAAAGYCYVGALSLDGEEYVVALLACGWPNNKSYKWSDTKRLMSYGLDNYNNKKLILPYKSFIYHVINGQYDTDNESVAYVDAVVNGNEKEYLISENDSVNIVYENEEHIEAPVKKGDVLGKVKIYINDYHIEEYDIVARNNIQKKSIKWAIKEIIKYFV